MPELVARHFSVLHSRQSTPRHPCRQTKSWAPGTSLLNSAAGPTSQTLPRISLQTRRGQRILAASAVTKTSPEPVGQGPPDFRARSGTAGPCPLGSPLSCHVLVLPRYSLENGGTKGWGATLKIVFFENKFKILPISQNRKHKQLP